MRKPVLFAAAFLAFLPAFGARAAEPSPTDTADPSSPDSVVVPVDVATAASPELTIDTVHFEGGDSLDRAFKVTFHFSDTVTGFTLTDIDFTNAAPYTQLTRHPEADADTMFIVSISVREFEGTVTVGVEAGKAENKEGEGNTEDTMEFAVDNKAPVLESAWVSGDTIRLEYDELLDEGKEPSAGSVTPQRKRDGGEWTDLDETDRRVRKDTLLVILARADTVRATDSIRITYTPTEDRDNAARDERGNRVPALTNEEVRNTKHVPPRKPGKVRNLEADAIDTATIEVDWREPVPDSGITGYVVEAREDTADAYEELQVVAVPTTQYDHTGLRKGARWHYRVTARSGAGDGPADSVVASTKGGTPGPPRSLEAEAHVSDSITLTWLEPFDDGGSDIAKYLVERSPDGVSWPEDYFDSTVAATPTAYTDTAVAANETWHYRVSAVNADTVGDHSGPASATTTGSPPGPPTDLEATALDTSRVFLTWRPPEDDGGSPITGYWIRISLDGTDWTDAERNTGNADTTYTDPDLSAGTTYHYEVSAINGVGEGSFSAPDTATTFDVPGQPTDLEATALDTSRVFLAWSAPEDDGGSPITGYRIRISLDGTDWTDAEANTGNADTTYTDDSGLSAGTTYHYRVSAINGVGEGSFSAPDTATTFDVPGQPTGFDATAQDTSRIDLSWGAPDDGGSPITGYRIGISLDGIDWTDSVANTGETLTTYTHSNLPWGATRHYRVSAINKFGVGPASAVDFATTYDVPDEPTGLDATAIGQTQINLAWNAPVGNGGSPIDGYRIEISGNSGATWSDLVPDTRSTSTAYPHTGRSAGETWHYRVSAKNRWGYSEVSNVDSATTDAREPDAPTGLEATASGQTRIDLAWKAPDDNGGDSITGYKIQYSENAGEDWDVLEANTGSTVTSYPDTGLDPGTRRHYRVAAINSVGAGDYSNEASATTDPTVPGAPTGLVAAADGTSQINLSWTAPEDDGGSEITWYIVEVSKDGSAPWVAEDHRPTVTSYKHTGLDPGETRHYRVSARNVAGIGAASDPDSATTDPVVPDAPTGLYAAAEGTSQINVTWSAPSYDGGDDITGYRVDISADGGVSWPVQDSVGANVTSYTHTGLEPATTRHYRVAALNSAGASTPSNVDGATTDATVPDAPTGLEAVAEGTAQIDLTWSAPEYDGGDEVSGYRVDESRDGGGTWKELVANVALTTYSHTGLDPATTVHYRVRALNGVGAGPWSDTAAATTDATVPDPPTDLEAVAEGTSQIDLAWSAPEYDGGAAVSGYQIEESRDAGGTWKELVANVALTTFSHTGLDPATTVHYRVRALNEVGASLWSDTAAATTDATVPDPPTDLEAVSAGISQIDLAWRAPEYDGGAAVSGYQIEESRDGGGTWMDVVANTGSTSTEYSHTGLDPATTVHYRVSAINSVGAGDHSNEASATTDPDFADPPTGLGAEANGPYEIELSWTAPVYTGGVPVTGYRIEVLASGGEWKDLVDDTRSTSTSHVDEGLMPASTRSYRVSAINAAGVGDPSEVATATTDPVVPDAPTALTVEADGTSRLLLSWTAPEYDGGAEITGYMIEVSETGSVPWDTLEANTNTTATNYAHEDLRPATTRHYRVSAINEAGTGPESDQASATTDATVPDPPTGLAATADGPYLIQLAWEVPPFDGGAPISGYRVEVSEDRGTSWKDLDANTGSTETSYQHDDLDPAATRHYRVSAINEIGTGDPSGVASATTDAIPPDPPTGLTATAVSPTQIDLAWVAPEYDGGAEITGYQIEMSADSAATWAILEASTGSTATVYAHTGLVPGSTRFYRVSAINVAGTGEPSNVASASTDDPVGRAGRVNQAILPHFAAASTTSALSAIAARIEAVADRNPLTSQLKAAGLASLVGRAGRDGALSSRLIDGMSFAMPLGGGEDTEGLGVATWGSAEYTSMSDLENEEVTWEGGLLSLHLGVDVRVDRDFLVGVSAGRSSGTYDFTDLTGARDVSGTYEARMNSLYPYIAWLPGRTGVAVWGVSGFGWGEVVVDDTIAGRRIGTARSMTGALGASRLLAASGGSKLRVRTEGWASRVKVDGDAQMDSLTIDMQRGRLALEWSQGRSFGGGDEVVFMLEGGARFGRSDGTEGVGMEVGGGLRYNNPAAGLTLEGRARLLSAGSGYRETGIRGLLQVDPQGSDGLSVKIVPSVGDAASSVDELWDRGVGQLAQGGSALARRVDASVEYGFAGFHGTPYSRIRMVDGGSQSIGTGVRYDLAELLKVQLEGTRNQGGVGPAKHAVSLRGQLVF